MTNEYSRQNLLELMAESEGYESLPESQKEVIQNHIKANNKPVMMYIYYQLLEEKQKNDYNKHQLAEKIAKAEKLSQQDIQDNLKEIL